jgi:hypothetical protein
MEILELKDFSEGDIFSEDHFDRKVLEFDWERFRDKAVRVSNCGLTQVPGWVYMQIGIELAWRARKVFFGDPHNPRRVFRREAEVGS